MTSLGCTPCLRIKRILQEIRVEMPNLTIEEGEFTSPNGSKLAVEIGILYPLATFLNGQLIAKGKTDASALMAQTCRANEMAA